MDFDKIHYFLTLADILNYTQAAEKLYISQSMLTRHIQTMEMEFGVQLFRRNSRGVQLTPAGLIMADGMRELRKQFGMLLKTAVAADSGFSGTISIGVLNSYMLSNITKIIEEYEAEHPDIHISLTPVDTTLEMRRMLLSDKLDFVFGPQRDFESCEEVNFISVCYSRVCIVMSDHNPIACEEPSELKLADLKNETFITFPYDVSPAQKALISRCAKAGFYPKMITAPDISTIILWIMANRGIAMLHDNSVFLGNPSIKLKYFDNAELSAAAIVWKKGCTKPSSTAFIDYLCKNDFSKVF